MPPLPAATAKALLSVLPSFGTPHNPLDITGGAVLEPELFAKALEIMGHEPAFSALAVLFDVPATEAQATEFQIASLRQISAGAEGPAAAGADDQPYDEAGHRGDAAHRADLGLPYTGGGDVPRPVGARPRLVVVGAAAPRGCRLGAAGRRRADRAEWPRTERAVLDHLARHGVPIVPATLATDEA